MAAVALLKETAFGGAGRVVDWAGTGHLTDAWKTDSKPVRIPGNCSAVISSQHGLCLTWEGKPERVRLLQALDHRSLQHGEDGFVVELHAVFARDGSLQSKVEWIAILEEAQTDKKPLYFLSKFQFGSIDVLDTTIVVGSARIQALDPEKTYVFCIQFCPHASPVTIRNVELGATPATVYDSRPRQSGTPTEPTPLPATLERRQPPALVKAIPPRPPTSRKRALVIAWDMAHNPVGRAYLLAEVLQRTHDVILIGPLFERYGRAVWAPVRHSGLEVHTFPAKSSRDFLEAAAEFVSRVEADVVYVCKCRLPGIVLGLLLKHRLGCPLVLDIDDHELSFFPGSEPVTLQDFQTGLISYDDLDEPYGRSWTQLCESLIPYFDGLTVSNCALRDRFGGTIVGHARDETKFRNDPKVRGAVRAQLGFGTEDRVILFLGTPRAHKGIFRLAAALEDLADPRLTFCIIGTANDKSIEARLAAFTKARIRCFPDQPWDRLPELINLADGVCLLQDADSPVSRYQMPAKMTDALSTGIPVAVTDVEPMRDVPSPSIVRKIHDDADLRQFLSDVAHDRMAADGFASRAREYFMEHLSYQAVSRSLNTLLEQAGQRPPQWPDVFRELLAFLERRFGVRLSSGTPAWAKVPDVAPALHQKKPINLAFFWKQNDTGIYGRRHDMLLKYLSQHPRIGCIVQFDAPIAASRLTATQRALTPGADQGNLVTSRTIERFLEAADTGAIKRRVFVYGQPGQDQTFLGRRLMTLEQYPGWVRQRLREVDSEHNFLSWVAPVVSSYPQLHDEIGFRATIADIIDDEREMATTPERRMAASETYEATFERAGIVFANCAGAAQAFARLRADIIVIPNAAEITELPAASFEKPAELRAMTGPVIGYVGNLRDRIDVPLLARLANERPHWNIVLIGSAHGNPEALRLKGTPNIHFLGVRPYDMIHDYTRSFDVAIMPHLHNNLSQTMSPLKLYVYCSAGVPVVSTAVCNIEEMAPYMHIADDAGSFIACIDRILDSGSSQTDRRTHALPYHSSWGHRVETIMAVIERAL